MEDSEGAASEASSGCGSAASLSSEGAIKSPTCQGRTGSSLSAANPTLSTVLGGSLEAAALAAEAVLAKRCAGETAVDAQVEAAEEDGPVSALSPQRPLRKLTEAQAAVVSNLTQRQILTVMDGILSGEDMDGLLRTTAPQIVQRVKEAGESQNNFQGELEETAAAVAAAASSARSDPGVNEFSAEYFLNVSKFVPLRLSYDERRFLRLLEGTLEVSEYSDRVDVLMGGSRARRIVKEIRSVCSILAGLVVANDFEAGQRLLRDTAFETQSSFFRAVFEIGRRYKRLNPDMMRSAYGKLLYFLMDSTRPEIQQMLNFDCVAPVQTVYTLLASKENGLALLSDPLVAVATRASVAVVRFINNSEVLPHGKTRPQIDKELREKDAAIKTLVRKYASKHTTKPQLFFGLRLNLFSKSDDSSEELTEGLTEADIEQCLYSLADNNSNLRMNRDPCEKMIRYLRQYFTPEAPDDEFSLSISFGSGGARLSHSHSRQYLYVLQSLTLWREILGEFVSLWAMAEADLLSPGNPYRLRDTGQGLNRVQDSPRVSRAMGTLLSRVQERTAGWVGSSVVHLGDHNVPNALMFIDKYTQVPRILNPLVLCIEKLGEVYENPSLKNYIDSSFGGLYKLR